MAYELTESQRERLEQIVYEIENSKLPLHRLALELMLSRDLVAAVRDSSRRSPRMQRALDRIPRISDRQAWDRLSAGERAEAQLEIYMRKGFE